MCIVYYVLCSSCKRPLTDEPQVDKCSTTAYRPCSDRRRYLDRCSRVGEKCDLCKLGPAEPDPHQERRGAVDMTPDPEYAGMGSSSYAQDACRAHEAALAKQKRAGESSTQVTSEEEDPCPPVQESQGRVSKWMEKKGWRR